MTGFDDLREWMELAKGIEELTIIEGATIEEIPVISQINSRNRGPAVFFAGIPGCDPSFGVMTNFLQNERTFGLTFGFPGDYKIGDLVKVFKDKLKEWENAAAEYHPEYVDEGPILENVLEGDAIDLTKFPVPTWHELDAGPYIGTGDCFITRDPDLGVINCGTYRAQLFDERNIGAVMISGQHGWLHREKYFKKGEPCPVVVVLGPDPLLFALSGSKVPEGVSELDYAGAVRGKPIKVVKGKLTGLPIPASAEIAIEGFLVSGETRREGPFGEWTGSYAGGERDDCYLRSEILYYRDSPILCGSPVAKGSWRADGMLHPVFSSASLYKDLESAGVRGVTGVWRPEVGGGRHLIIVGVEQRHPGHATQVGAIAAQAGSSVTPTGRYVIVVDDDIDVYDLEDVLWAVCARSRPEETDILKETRSSFTDTSLRGWKVGRFHSTARAIVYATKPYERLGDYPPMNVFKRETRQKVFETYRDRFGSRWECI